MGQRVLIISQGSDGYEIAIADYYSLRRFTLHPALSWGLEPQNALMQKVTDERMAEILLTASLIWPIRVDDWMLGVLAPLVDDPACRADPTRYFLMRDGETPSRYRCVPRGT